MVQDNKINLQLTKTQLKRIQDEVKNENGTTIKLSNKNFNKNHLLQELHLTQSQMEKLIEKIEIICRLI